MRVLPCSLVLVAALALASKGIRATVGTSSLSFLVGPETKLRYPDTIPSALSRNTSQRVAIIGGGAAGLTAAATLQQLGYKDVVVFESNPAVGGKCFSVEIDGDFYDLGAIQVSSAYKMVPALAAATKTPFYRYSAVPKDQQAVSNSSSNLGSNSTGGGLSALESVGVYAAGVANLAATSKRYLREVTAPGMLQASESASLAGASFSDFAAENKFGALLTQRLVDAMTGFGYSYDSTTSAAFWMRLVPDLGLVTGELETLWPSFKRYGLGTLTFEQGFQSLWKNVARDIGSNPGTGKIPVVIKTGTRVVGVSRTNATTGGVQVSFTSSNSAVVATETFDRLIVTAPLQTAQSFMQLTPQETALFGQIKTVRYLVTVAEPPAGSDDAAENGRFFSQNTVPSRVNHPVVFTRQHRSDAPGGQRRSSLRTFYQILDDTITTAAATAILVQDALELTGVPLGQVKAQRNWEGDVAYFPHLSSESMGAGWYKDVEAMQGQQGTFWAGSVMSFEDVERTSVFANYLALRWF